MSEGGLLIGRICKNRQFMHKTPKKSDLLGFFVVNFDMN